MTLLKGLLLVSILCLTLSSEKASTFGINVEAETSVGSKFWTIRKIRQKFYHKLHLGIHEAVTADALGHFDFSPKQKRQITYGILFNDDPAGLLFPKSFTNVDGYEFSDSGNSKVNGVKFFAEMAKILAKMKRRAVLQKEVGHWTGWVRSWWEDPQEAIEEIDQELHSNVLWASHYGDLQYLHAMGDSSESRDKILSKMRKYAQHAWTLATGEQSYKDLLAKVREAKRRVEAGETLIDRENQLLARFKSDDIFFNTRDRKKFRFRALGSLLHMIQDSYAQGHAVRENWNEEIPDNPLKSQNSGRIIHFQNYADQDGGKHSVYDTPHTEDPDDWDLVPGALKAADRTSDVIALFEMKCSWEGRASDLVDCPVDGVEGYLFNEVFAVEDEYGLDFSTRTHPAVAKSAE